MAKGVGKYMNPLEYKKQYESEYFRDEKEAPQAMLGALYTPEETWFRVWAPDAERVEVLLYTCGTEEENPGELPRRFIMNRSERVGESWVWEAIVPGNLHTVYYTYEVYREGGSAECVDIYAKACGADGRRGMVVDLHCTNPEGWQEDGRWRQENKNTVLYELHVKDFSYHQGSGVPREHRGKYLAFADQGKKNTCISHLKELGVSHVHLLPVFDFASVEETGDENQFNWGYDPVHYNIPEGSYATDARHGQVRIEEFKRMVQALHGAGIGVVMDVVYNHTYSADGNFQVLAPYYYYRQKADGSLADGSACGNETASERPMCGKFIRESVLYWAEEYHIDGFRFDLMGLHDTETLNGIRQALDERFPDKDILMYGEPWAAAPASLQEGFYPAVKENLFRLSDRIAIFSDDTRDAVKGSVFRAREAGFVNGGSGFEQDIAASYLAWCGQGRGAAPKSPRQIITYVSAHDNYTLWDKLVLTKGEGRQDYVSGDQALLAQNKLTAAIVMTCLGTPFFQAGEEFARTKYGDWNSYKSSASINCLDWDRREQFGELVEYYRGLIALRGRLPIYRDQTRHTADRVSILHADDGWVEVCLDMAGMKSEWNKVYIVANASGEPVPFHLPEGRYQKLADEKSSWLWKKTSRWSRIKKEAAAAAPGSVGIWGKLI